ncbi:MAG: galactose mutarotase [Cyclobacteriaceae bacterium]|nr:galactose mutarotase [Cyclobacteriaceae bacterium]
MESLQVFELTNRRGMKLTATNFGGKVISLWVPDRKGVLADVVLGYDHAAHYLQGNPHFGALIGRYANRIANGRFTLNGKDYSLTINNRNNALHGGVNGFHNVLWRVEESSSRHLKLSYVSQAGEEGYPGNLTVLVEYKLTDDNEFIIDYRAETDETTPVNLTSHSFFNLAGEGHSTILDHELMINASQFCAVDENLIPTGILHAVNNTVFDFTTPTRIGSRIQERDTQLTLGNGYDHTWVLNKNANELSLAARVIEPRSGRVMEVFTTEPGIQFYSGNFLDGSDIGKGGKPYGFRSALCLEAQHFPDSPNQPSFPSTILQPNETYRQTTVHRFLVA